MGKATRSMSARTCLASRRPRTSARCACLRAPPAPAALPLALALMESDGGGRRVLALTRGCAAWTGGTGR
eukprot:scaffold320293_cov30-Tisochrysis_lutea.AAC.3